MLSPSMNWQTLTNFTMMGAMAQIDDTPPASSDSRFYRAVMTP